MVGNQIGDLIANLTPGLSFGHNLCFRCPNGSCKPIWDIYVPRAFKWYKEIFNPLGFDPCNCSLKIWDSNSQSGSSLGSVSIYSLTLSYTPRSMSDSQSSFWPAPLQALTLVASPRLRLRQTCYLICVGLCE
jgi:hypothetical protein